MQRTLLTYVLARMSFATDYSNYSKEENCIVERDNQEVKRHLSAMLFDARVHDK